MQELVGKSRDGAGSSDRDSSAAIVAALRAAATAGRRALPERPGCAFAGVVGPTAES